MASEIEQKIIPLFAKSALKVVPTETESITASTAIPDNSLSSPSFTLRIRFCSVNEIPNFSKVALNSGSMSSIESTALATFGAE